MGIKEIRRQGWIKSSRTISHGNVGNTLEDLLGIEENNPPIPNASEWELKCQGFILIDFDAGTGHNHRTKFRFRKNQQ